MTVQRRLAGAEAALGTNVRLSPMQEQLFARIKELMAADTSLDLRAAMRIAFDEQF